MSNKHGMQWGTHNNNEKRFKMLFLLLFLMYNQSHCMHLKESWWLGWDSLEWVAVMNQGHFFQLGMIGVDRS